MTGNVKFAAEKLSAALKADLLRVEPVKAYPDKGFKKFFWGGKSAVMGEAPALEPYSFSADDYDLIVFGFPVWAGTFAPPLRTFISENRGALSSKRIAALACSSGGNAAKAFEKLSALAGKELEASLSLTDPKARPTDKTNGDIARFAASLEKE